jgi:hypothetical protein
MAIDKALNQAPLGLNAVGMQPGPVEPDLEIEIEDPESVTLRTGDLEIEIEPGKEEDDEFNENLAEKISEDVLEGLAAELVSDYEDDVASRKDWMQTYVDGLELLGMKLEERSEPWEGACGVYHPLLSEALVKFQSETIMATFPASGPVKTQIIGKETPAKKKAAERVQNDMNYQLTEVMTEYRSEHERMLWGLGLSGNAFKKVYFDPSRDRQASIFVPAEDVVVPYGSEDLQTAERVTHVMRKSENDLKKLMVGGFYRDVDLGDPVNSLDEVEKKIAEKMGFRATSDDRFKLLEMQVNLDLPGYEDEDGIALPYIVTLEKGTNTVLAIRRNWEPDDETKQKRTHFVHYGYIPGFGFYYFGLIHLIGAYAKSGTSILRQLVDAGTLANLPGGLKTKGMRTKGDDTPISPGEWRDVDVASGTIRDNILPLPYKEPSQVLKGLMDQIVDEGRRFASAADLQVSDMSAQAPVGTTLALLERQLKVMSAVQARIHFAMKQEFKLLKHIIAAYAPEEYSYDPADGDRMARRQDYDDVDVIPVSDPNAATMSQKVVQYQAVMQMAQATPQVYDMVELNRQMLEVLGIKNIGKLVPSAEDQKPKDPVAENMAILNMKPVKAFAHQDHEAHIQVHMAAMQDPKIAALVGQHPQAQAMMAAGMAHINEHVAFQYRKQIEEMLGVPLPQTKDDEVIPQDIENQIASMMAMASAKLLQKNQAEASQQQAQEAAQDPVIQMQQQELELKAKEVDIKGKKLEIDAVAQAEKIRIEHARIEAQKEIAGLQAGAKATHAKNELDSRMQTDGIRLGMQATKDRMELESKRELEKMRIRADVAKSHTQLQQQLKARQKPTKE